MSCFGLAPFCFRAALDNLLFVSVILTNIYPIRMTFRVRNPLLRTVYNRMYTDDMERSTDHSHVSWLSSIDVNWLALDESWLTLDVR